MIAPQHSGSHPRVAFFTETFNEINGVALTARQIAEFAARSDRGARNDRSALDGCIR